MSMFAGPSGFGAPRARTRLCRGATSQSPPPRARTAKAPVTQGLTVATAAASIAANASPSAAAALVLSWDGLTRVQLW